MGYDSNGNWTLTPGYLAIAGQTIQPSQHNPVLEDIGQNGLSAVLVRDGRAPMTGALNMNSFKVTNLLAGSNPLDAVNKQQLDDVTIISTQCRLILSGANLLLSRYNGRRLTINGVSELIPQAGITLAPPGLTPSTLYYIYAYMNSGTMTLEASATAPATDATTGIQIKTGDTTRSLVGMARPIAGPLWVDTIGQRFVRSWYNRDKPRGAAVFTADRSTTSPILAELNTEIRNEVLLWADENIQANFSGWGQNTGANTSSIKIIMDSTSTELARCATGLISASSYSCSGAASAGTVGYHWVSVAAFTSGGTFTVFGTGSIPGLLNTTIV